LGSSFAVITLGLWVSGFNVATVFSALINGAGGDTYRLAETFVKACPLLLTGLSVALALHAGAWNIGAEGQLLIGALLAAWLGAYTSSLPPGLAITVVCLASMFGGALWASCAALLKNARGVSEVISTIMLNFIAANLVSYCVHGPLMEAGAQYPQTDPLPLAAQLPRLLPPTRLHLGIVLGLIIAVGVHVFLFRTKEGLKLRASGANATAARFAGIVVERQLLIAFTLSGALAGLAGGIEVSGITQRVYEKFSPGYGYTAIAVALVGQRAPLGVILASFFFGALEAGSGAVQRIAGVSSVLVSIIQATVIFFLAAYSTPIVQRFFKKSIKLATLTSLAAYSCSFVSLVT
jgi:simple sugar transport system permease protein